MKLRPLLTCLLLAACGQQTPTPSEPRNIFGIDARQTPPDTTPYQAVGRLDAGCTGTLIGKRLVLTAAHCVINQTTGAVNPLLTYFRPDLRGGKSKETLWVDYAWLGS